MENHSLQSTLEKTEQQIYGLRGNPHRSSSSVHGGDFDGFGDMGVPSPFGAAHRPGIAAAGTRASSGNTITSHAHSHCTSFPHHITTSSHLSLFLFISSLPLSRPHPPDPFPLPSLPSPLTPCTPCYRTGARASSVPRGAAGLRGRSPSPSLAAAAGRRL